MLKEPQFYSLVTIIIQFRLKYEKHMNCFVVDFSQGNTKKNQADLIGLYREGGLSERGVALETLH